MLQTPQQHVHVYIYMHLFPSQKTAYLNTCGLIVGFPRLDDDDDDVGDNDEQAVLLKRELIENSLQQPFDALFAPLWISDGEEFLN
ncbi:hypothetical protein TNCT_411571 [Trichonephila clavata]|uniref:Uncharacterized protein n=1 Tax=Trichonephila clavata TaxID=2740835 RepID=A0A8X6FGN0_TRICU|nr:hypothetical protein TNCT_411571 [Trichonephila clavata]